jgi:prevent-host-death family protein
MMARTRNEVVTVESLGEETVAVVGRAAAGDSVILTIDGRPAAAVVSLEKLQSFERERELLRRLALGELESAAGEGDELESVLADCRLLLEES